MKDEKTGSVPTPFFFCNAKGHTHQTYSVRTISTCNHNNWLMWFYCLCVKTKLVQVNVPCRYAFQAVEFINEGFHIFFVAVRLQYDNPIV